jgi:heptosyltransferase-1
MKSINKIAIVKLSAMGDIIHAMICLQFLKKEYPNLHIDWFVEKGFSQLLDNNPHIDNIIEVNLKNIKKDKLSIFKQIKEISKYKKNDYDLVIDAQGLLKSAIVSKLIGKHVVGFSKDSIREGIAALFYKQKVSIPYEENVIKRNLKVLCKTLDIELNEEDILNKESFLYSSEDIKDTNIIFVVGASVKNKIYPKEKFLKLAKLIKEDITVIWGNDEEHKIAQYLSQNSSNIKISKRLNLNQLKSIISNSKLVIGADTGPTHMAWALNIPSITIFGNTPEYRNTYITNINKVIKSKTKVNPLKLDKNDFSIIEINEEGIYDLVKELLE